MEPLSLTKLTNMRNPLQHALDNEKDVKEKTRNVFSDVNEEYEANDKLLKEIKDLSISPKHLGLKVSVIDLRNKDLQTMRSLLDVLISIKKSIKERRMSLQIVGGYLSRVMMENQISLGSCKFTF